MDPTACDAPQPSRKRTTRAPTTFDALGRDILCMIFALLGVVDLCRCSAVCKSWSTIINRFLKINVGRLAVDDHNLSLEEGLVDIYQWKGHSLGVDQCRMKRGMILTGVGDKVMRLWSAESYKYLDEYILPERTPLIDFDFDENKVVGVAGTCICIWRRNGKRNIFSSCERLFTKPLCMRYVDPEAVVGCEDGRAYVFDMYSRKCSRIIETHAGPMTSLSLSDDQFIFSGSYLGTITISDLSSGQRGATLRSTGSAGVATLCFNPCSRLLFAGSTTGYASCWDLRTLKILWETRVSSNVVYSMNHLRNDTSTLVTGGIDGVLRVVNQDTGEVLSRYIMDGSSSSSECSKGLCRVSEKKKARRLSEDTRIDLMSKGSRPPITCLAVGMKKVVTTHADKYIRVWKFNK